MPQVEKMSWLKESRRWRKMYKGITYYISAKELDCHETKEDSLSAANQWWEQKLDTLLQAKADDRHLSVGITYNLFREVALKGIRQCADAWQEEIKVNRLSRELVSQVKEALNLVLDRIDQPYEVIGENWAQEYLALERKRVSNNSTFRGIRDSVMAFDTWLNGRKITPDTWEQWFDELRVRYPGNSTRRHYWTYAKAYVIWLLEKKYLAELSNLNSKRFKIPVDGGDKIVWTADEVTNYYRNVPDLHKLFFLLGLNCGMMMSDCASLKQSEVDWTNKTITRKRSKTKGKEKVPIVTYQLWDETYDLLCKFRSKDKVLVLTREDGTPIHQEEVDGFDMSVDNPYYKQQEQYRYRYANGKPMRNVRHTSSTLIRKNPVGHEYYKLFLGHAPTSTADIFYADEHWQEFFSVLKWLREQYTL